MKTLHPLILTAKIADADLQPFDDLRQKHFPPDRNFLRAHLTMFHRLPGEYIDKIIEDLQDVAEVHSATAEVSGIRHLGAGVAFTITSPELLEIHLRLKQVWRPWLGGQDMQKWQPHITIQNKVSRTTADATYQKLAAEFRPHSIEIVGLDLWRYMGGPWEHNTSQAFRPWLDR
ncbi:2'-5' RNA ligase family protein [Agrobacterium bohemicum]|uniref:Phosphoesterase HXTX n=1 Tax=Agrobacterium bohemicum TaxID=2052828 RepID=A0A135P151_9HYPH|nr:2'-5' RNA ligase family protein [Agrobacterium bohemicum]KXG85140.1 hypothetical protein ATO67_07925 [Agrobacterium bohemicum]